MKAPDVVGPGEALEILKMSRPTFSDHKRRPDFPPAAHLSCGDVYERRAIVAYGRQWRTGKPYLRALELSREVAHITPDARCKYVAPQLEVSAPTVRRWLQELGELER